MSTPPLKFKGCAQFRQRLVFATLAQKRIIITNIRDNSDEPGLKDFEASFLRLLENLTNGCRIEINETGTTLRYQPGLISGGDIEHDCGNKRAIGWFLEGILPLAPFGKKPVNLTLTGITNDDTDFSVDLIKLVHLPLFPHFGVSDGLRLDINKRGVAPLGGGMVNFFCPSVRELKPINLIDEGYVKRIRGLAYTCKVSPQMANRIVGGARGIFNNFLADVFIYTDHNKGENAGKSPGYGVTLVATSTSGVVYGSQRSTNPKSGLKHISSDSVDIPEALGEDAAGLLLDEVNYGGCIDSNTQPLAFALLAVCPEEVSRLRIGQLSPAGVATLRLIHTFFGIKFHLQPDIQEVKAAPKIKRKLVTNDMGEEVEVEDEPEPAPLTAEIRGGHSGRSIMVTSMGIGYKNFAKRVT